MAAVKRPHIITVIASMGILTTLFAFPMMFIPSIKRMGDFVPMTLGIIITFQFVSFIGIWHMKQWGVRLFIIVFSIRVVTFMLLELYNFQFFYHILYSIVFIIFFLMHYREMDKNL